MYHKDRQETQAPQSRMPKAGFKSSQNGEEDGDSQAASYRQLKYNPASPPFAKKQFPQKSVDEFWKAFRTRYPGKIHTILPQNVFAKSKAAHTPLGRTYAEAAHESYDEARDAFEKAVSKIARECRRVNMRYRDPHFDIEFDLKRHQNNCLEGLVSWGDEPMQPKSVKRVTVLLHLRRLRILD